MTGVIMDENQQVVEAEKKAALKLLEPKDDLLIFLVVVNRHTGKAEITQFCKMEKVKFTTGVLVKSL